VPTVSPAEQSAEQEELSAAVAGAQQGDRQALERVVLVLQDDVYRLALRMTAHPEDARDAAQEILIKIVTRLDSFRGESSVRTWAYRIAVRHVLDRKKSRVEALALDFQRFGADLLDGLASEPDPDPLLAEEVKLGCTLAMLTCLDREHRLAYVLADVFDLEHAEAAEFCGVTEATYRQRLSRARRVLETFTKSFCGVVNQSAPCSCARRVKKAEELGRVQRQRLPAEQRALETAHGEMESLHATARLMRTQRRQLPPPELFENIRKLLEPRLRLLSD
jgi:RNA polymerase sigma factor (sigma-70 family)